MIVLGCEQNLRFNALWSQLLAHAQRAPSVEAVLEAIETTRAQRQANASEGDGHELGDAVSQAPLQQPLQQQAPRTFLETFAPRTAPQAAFSRPRAEDGIDWGI